MDELKQPEMKSSDRLYLEKLTFRPELRKSVLNFFVTNFRVVVLMIMVLTAIGIYSFTSLPRESNPEVKIPIAVIITTYPGASPADMEELVTKKIETSIAGLKNINKITSRSANSLSSITVEYDAKADLDDSLRKLRDQINTVKKDLPTDAKEPVVREVSIDDTPVWTASFTGPSDGFTLRKEAEDIQDELEKIPGVREVTISGGDRREFEVAYDPLKLASFGISPEQANQAIRSTNLAIPGGTFEGSLYSFPVRTDSRFYEAVQLGSIPILHAANGGIVVLNDVAVVRERAIKKTVRSRYALGNGEAHENITISVVKKTGGSIINTVKAVDEKMDEAVARAPKGTAYSVITDLSDRVNKDFEQLTHDFLITLVLVFAVLFLIVGFKEAMVAGLAIPLVFFATFGVMLVTGTSLNFLSLFALILSLGLLVDDAIVVVSATKQYLNTGKFTPEEAVLLVLNDFKVVLLTTTLTTVWAFLPLLSASGIIGQYIKSIPITVSVTLISSLFIALFINHPLAAVLERIRFTKTMFGGVMAVLVAAAVGGFALKSVVGIVIAVVALTVVLASMIWFFLRGKKNLLANEMLSEAEWNDDDLIKQKLREQGSHVDTTIFSKLMHGVIHFDRVLPLYEKVLQWCLRSRLTRFLSLGGVAVLFAVAVSLPITGIVKTEFFPVGDSELLYVNIQAPTGLNLVQTDAIAAKVEARMNKYPEIVSYSTLVGAGSAAGGSGSGGSGSNLASLTIKLKTEKERVARSYEIAEKMRADFADIKEATISVLSPAGGPPAGADFDARISGEDLQTLDKIANELKPKLAALPGVLNPDISLKASPADYTFTLKPDRMELYSLTGAQVGSVLRMAISGSEVTTVIRDGKEIKVQARFLAERIPTLEAIQNLQILNNAKQPVFLKDVATIELKPSVDTITRIDKKRTVELTASVDVAHRPADVVTAFQNVLAKEYKLPEGYAISYGGQNEQNQESVLSILRAMIIAALLIVATMIIQFNSFRQSLIVLVTIPLALIGVFFGLAITGIRLSFPGLIGIVALFGIVVKNAIILVDKINLNRKSGIEFKAAIVDACKSRLEAIFITSICTIFGIIPITLSNETWKALGGAVIFGLMLSSFFTLFVIPTLYMVLMAKKERPMSQLKTNLL